MILLGADAPGTSPDPPAFAIRVTVAPEISRYAYHFNNDSTFDTGPLVPHFFEQKYDASAIWTFVAARYRLANAPATTTVGLTPSFERSGSDVDTFFQTSGDVVTSGTRGDVNLGSFSIEQRFELSRWHGWRLGVVLAFNRSRAGFLPSDRIVTHTTPASETREPVPGHETTWSSVLASGVSIARDGTLGHGWRVDISGDLRPLTRARLNVSLPDKYPGQDIFGSALALGANARVSFSRPVGRLVADIAISGEGATGYRPTADYHAKGVGLSASLTVPLE